MDKDEILVSIAQSFVDKDLTNAVIVINKVDDNYSLITFCVDNNNEILNNKKMISELDIEVGIDLKNEAIGVEKISRNGWIIVDDDGYETQNIWEERKKDYYTLVSDDNSKYLQCEFYISNELKVSIDTIQGSRGHTNYEEKRLGKTRIDVVDEYSIMDGYPVSKTLKKFTKVYYNSKNNQDK